MRGMQVLSFIAWVALIRQPVGVKVCVCLQSRSLSPTVSMFCTLSFVSAAIATHFLFWNSAGKFAEQGAAEEGRKHPFQSHTQWVRYSLLIRKKGVFYWAAFIFICLCVSDTEQLKSFIMCSVWRERLWLLSFMSAMQWLSFSAGVFIWSCDF